MAINCSSQYKTTWSPEKYYNNVGIKIGLFQQIVADKSENT